MNKKMFSTAVRKNAFYNKDENSVLQLSLNISKQKSEKLSEEIRIHAIRVIG